jgi:DNA-binding NarL/FixJ family response regulator
MTGWTGSIRFAACSARRPAATTCVTCRWASSRLPRYGRRLRALGVARIPRGPLSETRVNPAGLTGRQVDVLRLLSQGFTNAQIASQLVVSVRTVDSHVAAVLGKLAAASRREAGARGAELGLLTARER